MTERISPSYSYRHGKRGRHKRAESPETRAWEQISVDAAWLGTENGRVDDHVDPSQSDPTAPPKRPPWMDEATYQRLAKLREAL
jgi:hypothetical protein